MNRINNELCKQFLKALLYGVITLLTSIVCCPILIVCLIVGIIPVSIYVTYLYYIGAKDDILSNTQDIDFISDESLD